MSSSCCCIPGCTNRHIEWTTPLPRDELLQARWSDAIRAGTGGLSPVEARVCNAHFVGKGSSALNEDSSRGYGMPSSAMEYQEPTLFYRNNIPLQVTWCRLCLRHGTQDSMFNANGRSSVAEQSLSWMANKHFGVWLEPQHPSAVQYFCEQCKVRLEATHTFWLEIQQSAQKYRILQGKISTQKLPLDPSDQFMSKPADMYPAVDSRTLNVPPQKPFCVDIPAYPSSATKRSHDRLFSVVEFISTTPALKVLAVPTAWLQNDLLMWPRLMNGEAVYALRKEGAALNDAIETESFPVIVLQQFDDYNSAEAAVQIILQRRNPEPAASSSVPKDILTTTEFRKELHHLKNDLNSLIQTTIETAVERSICSNSNRPASFGFGQAQMGSNAHFHSNPAHVNVAAPEIVLSLHAEAEKHKKISNEDELDDFNTRLADPLLGQKYLEYFARIIHPKKYANKGDNALYAIADYLFTRDLWNCFTWTGVNRGQKSSRGFREFANVTELLLNIVLLGDSTYDETRLEQFCRAKLLRYSKTRAAGKQLRTSACRPGRKRAAAEDSRSSDGGGEMDPLLDDEENAQQERVVCKVEDFSDNLWRQSEDAHAEQYSGGMM